MNATRESTAERVQRERSEEVARALGWGSLVIGLLCWPFVSEPVSWHGDAAQSEGALYGSTFGAIAAALGMGFGFRAVRGGGRWMRVVWSGLLLNTWLVAVVITRFVSRSSTNFVLPTQ